MKTICVILKLTEEITIFFWKIQINNESKHNRNGKIHIKIGSSISDHDVYFIVVIMPWIIAV